MLRDVIRRPVRLAVLGVLVAAIVGLGSAQPASAAGASITSSGPLTNITISPDLNCAVNHTGDSFGEFFEDTACGTLVALAGTLYGPATIPAGDSASPRTPFTPVSQGAVTGSGTASSPYSITTVVDLGGTGFRLTETDSYVVGQEAYLTTVAINNNSNSGQSLNVYRAGDCYLQNSDVGLGRVDGSAVACKATTGSRIEQWFPITAGSKYMEDEFDTVWTKIGSQQPFDNTCVCDGSSVDNGAGLSWTESIAAGQSASVQHYTTFSPLGIQPITVTKTADISQIAPGGLDGYTISVANPGSTDVSLQTITDSLPAGFTYVAGTTTGGVTSDPTVVGQNLTWNGPITVTAGSTLSLHISVNVSGAVGTYTNSANATGSGLIIIGADNVAPVQVTTATTTASTPTTAQAATPTQAVPKFTG